ncbi:MAG: tyrosine-type recombinase/integrase [Paracoccaceae bacterium]|nr:tyrosine-type recombinase/integrase [Paracoccaceae bacterium]
MRKKLTDQLLKSTKPPAQGRTVITDTERAGLRFRITSSGSATFLLEKKIKGGKRRAFTLGSYPAMSLAEARAAALRIELEAQTGIDRIEAAQAEKAVRDAEALAARTVGDILEIYIATHIDKNLKEGQSREERKRQLRATLSPYLRLRMDALSRADLQRIVDVKAAEGKIPMANRLHAALCAFSGWAYGRGHIQTDPGASVQKAGREQSRKRTPSLDEVREIWAASYASGPLWGPYFRMCVLTGQRSRNEILGMEWSWVNVAKRRLEVPTTKNREPHIVHLADATIEELESIRQYQANRKMITPYIFTTTGTAPSSGVSKAKALLDQTIAENRARKGNKEPMEHWVLHDLRRAQATALAEAGFPETVVDRIQNHVAVGSRPSAVAAVYTLAKLLPERARALEYWAKQITAYRCKVIRLQSMN